MEPRTHFTSFGISLANRPFWWHWHRLTRMCLLTGTDSWTTRIASYISRKIHYTRAAWLSIGYDTLKKNLTPRLTLTRNPETKPNRITQIVLIIYIFIFMFASGRCCCGSVLLSACFQFFIMYSYGNLMMQKTRAQCRCPQTIQPK